MTSDTNEGPAEYFSDFITHRLIGALSTLGRRSSVFQIKELRIGEMGCFSEVLNEMRKIRIPVRSE